MKKTVALLCILIYCSVINGVFAQENKVFRSIEDALSVSKDSVFHLNLSKQKLTELPVEIITFTNLKTLDISKNKLTILPQEIEQLVFLEVFNAEKNDLTKFPIGVTNCKSLKIVNLGRNEIPKVPKEIEKLALLEKLDLWDNPLSDLPSSIRNLKLLKKLDLRGINFDKEIKNRIKSWLPNTNVFIDNSCDCGI